MNDLSIVYTIVGILSGFGALVLAIRNINARSDQKIEKAIHPVAEAVEKFSTTTQLLTEAAERDRSIAEPINDYEAVSGTSKALRQVIQDSTAQLAESSAQLAQTAQALAETREELRLCREEKRQLERKVEQLTKEVSLLRGQLASVQAAFTEHPNLDNGG